MENQPETAEAKKLRRRRCRNCDVLFQPSQETHWFHTDQCRYEFHKHGSAFGPLKIKLEKLVVKMMRAEMQSFNETVKLLDRRITELERDLKSPGPPAP